MDAAKKNEIQAHARAIAALLYEEADAEQVQTLAGIEDTVRAQLLKHVSPEIGVFLSKRAAARLKDAADFACILAVTHIPHFREAFETRIDVTKTPDGSQLIVSM